MRKILSVLITVILCMIVGCGGAKSDKPPIDNGTNELNYVNNFQETILGLSGKDDYSGQISAMDKLRSDKYVGIYYLTWFGEHRNEQQGIYNIDYLLETNPEALWDANGNEIAPNDQYYYWGEPLYGYYNSRDPWVIRRHIELLTNAGVDFFCVDTTNGFPYTEALKVFLDILLEYEEQGCPVPKVVLFTNTNSGSVTESHYNNLYKNEKYSSLWFAPHGKPIIINRDRVNPEQSLQHLDLKERDWFLEKYPEAADYFEFRASQWPQEQYIAENGFPWMDWAPSLQQGDYNGTWKEGTLHREWPDSEGRSVVSVSVAQHTALPFSDSVLLPNKYNSNRGRGWDYNLSQNIADKKYENINFCAQWEDIINNFDPEIVHVTGWNEWTAMKTIIDDRPWFIDTTNSEFSRDLEMMKGGYSDNAYMQLARYVREFKAKGITHDEINALPKSTIYPSHKISQWEGKGKIYSDFVGDAITRDYIGINSTVHYFDDSNRNDIKEIRVAHDDKNVYFLIRTAESLQFDYSANNWMNVYIGVEGSSEPSFYDWQYIVNRTVKRNGTGSIEKSSGGFNFSSVGEIQIYNGTNYIQFAIPRKTLGINAKPATLLFKVADNLQHPENIEDYYISGDCAPLGRLSYTYKLN